MSAAAIASDIAAQINATAWDIPDPDHLGQTIPTVAMPISAQAIGSQVTFTATKPGEDGNAITMYAVTKNGSSTIPFSGGVSDATWRVRLDFTALGITSVRQMFLTFAPPVSSGQAFTSTEWEATFTNWTVDGEKKWLQVAGPGSVRIEETDSACVFSHGWVVKSGFFSKGYARLTSQSGASVTIQYHCAFEHDLYIGTSLYTDRGSAQVEMDGVTLPPLITAVNTDPPLDAQINTRRAIATKISRGRHTVTLTSVGDGEFYFDFLEAAVASEVPDNLPARTNISPALDYSTDHTYKLPPARLMWILDKLGFAGSMNEYIGVFWWNQRKRTEATVRSASVTFSGQFLPAAWYVKDSGDQVWIQIGDQQIGKAVFP